MGRKSASTAQGGTLQQLDTLRCFVPAEMGFTESDLMDCLRQCGFNVNIAAERLITGEYKRGAKKAFLKMTAASPGRKGDGTMSSATKTIRTSINSAQASSNPKTPLVSSQKTKTPPLKSPPPTNPMTIDLSLEDDENQHNQSTLLNAATKQSATKPAARSYPSTEAPRGNWLLCHRWISDAICTTRNGAMDHKEVLQTEASGQTHVRLRGRALEGRFPEHIGRLLNPLLRADLVYLQVHSLMQEKNLPIGASIPVSLSVFLPQPKQFFEVFQNNAADSSINMAWGKSNRRPSKRKEQPLLEHAAFDLLQWAQYGDVPDFSVPDESQAEQVNLKEEVEMDESDFESATEEESSKLANEFSKALTSAEKVANFPECEDPVGLKDVDLRPYQKQALQWMYTRETEALSREEQEEQIALLADLSRANGKPSRAALPSTPEEDIVCECGPVQVSDCARERAKTCDGVTNPVSHPLWQRRFLVDPHRKELICFFVNEFMTLASHAPPSPPRPCSGGILADSMGLGKTVCCLSLILRSKQEQPEGSPSATLVVAKLSLLPQWEEEIKTKTNLTYAVYYGAQASREYSVEELQKVDIVLTTYGTMQGELKRKNPLLTQSEWLRVILDEAHCIRNSNTLASKACCSLKAKHRWAVSGTIMMNSMQDLFGIMKFLQHEPWCLPPFWKAAVTKPMLSYDSHGQNQITEEGTASLQDVLKRLRGVLAPIMLRRTIDSLTTDGKPILTLPPVETQTVYVDLTPTEREFYQAVLARSLDLFRGFVDAGTAQKSYLQILSMISRLRQCCDHISLTVRNRLDGEEYDNEEGENAGSQKGAESTPKTPSAGQNGLLGKKFMEGLMAKLSGTPKRKASSSAAESPSPTKRPRDLFLESVAMTLSQAVENRSTHSSDECPICLDPTPIAGSVLTPCGHQFCKECLVGFLRQNAPDPSNDEYPDGSCPVCNMHIEAKRIVALSVSRQHPERVLPSYLTAPSPVESPVKEERAQLPQAEEGSTARDILQDAVDGRMDSSKLKAVMDELQRVWEQDPGSKILIFSQFLGFLDLLQPRLTAMGVPYFRLDGQLSLSKRIDVLKEFKASSGPKGNGNKGSVMLMSMNAGGEGLNLVSASSVFIVDPWWNAAKEDQCVNRIVRLGQTAQICRVRKFVVRQSVEERIVELQTRKKYMADELYETVGRDNGGEAMGSAARLTLEDLKVLFQS